MARGIQSIILGFRLLQVIAEAGVPLSLKAISALSGMSPSKARMYLISFIETGMVLQNAKSQLYSLGPYALRLGARAQEGMDGGTVATAAMNSLQQETDALVLLSAWSANGVTLVSRSEGGAAPPLQFHLGSPSALADTAAGHVFLAFGPYQTIWRHLKDELAAAGIAHTKQKQRIKTLEALVQRVRRRRIAETDSISWPSGVKLTGYSAVAAPIFDVTQQLRYAMTLIFHTGATHRRREEFGRLTLQAADNASHAAGAEVIAAEG